MQVRLFFTHPVSLSNRTLLKQFIAELFRREGTAADSISIVFCSDAYLLEVNQRFLKHDFFTDIISFDLAVKNQPVEGELYISVERVKENATALGIPLRTELLRVIFHGCLHLCGYKDKSAASQLTMRGREDFYIDAFRNKVKAQ